MLGIFLSMFIIYLHIENGGNIGYEQSIKLFFSCIFCLVFFPITLIAILFAFLCIYKKIKKTLKQIKNAPKGMSRGYYRK